MHILTTIIEEIKQYQTIIIHRHMRPDGDCIGSQIGLKNMILQSFPEKAVYAVGEEMKKLSYIGKMDMISDDVYKGALVIVVDVANIERISDSRYRLAKKTIKIDHHPKRESMCDIEWVDPSYSSCCEMIVEFYHHFKDELSMTDEGFRALYYGIITDTNRFSNPNISSRTLKLASTLLDESIDLTTIYKRIYSEPLQFIRLKGHVMSNLTYRASGLGYFCVTKELCEQYGVDSSASNILANSLSFIEEVKVWFIAIYEEKSGKVRVSLRSEEHAINQVAEQFGGGGHKNASGIILDSFKEINHLVNAIETFINS